MPGLRAAPWQPACQQRFPRHAPANSASGPDTHGQAHSVAPGTWTVTTRWKRYCQKKFRTSSGSAESSRRPCTSATPVDSCIWNRTLASKAGSRPYQPTSPTSSKSWHCVATTPSVNSSTVNSRPTWTWSVYLRASSTPTTWQ